MSDKRQKNQLLLAFPGESRSEAPTASKEGTESLTTKRPPESPAWTAVRFTNFRVPETALASDPGAVAERNLQAATGTAGGNPETGRRRKLGIPTVLDRFIQQAVMQVLQRRWDRTLSDHSYGFRPGRSAHQAVEAAHQYITEGYRWCVDLDWEKFFDRVSHDKLMAKIAQRVGDKRLLKLIRAFLTAGVMEGGL